MNRFQTRVCTTISRERERERRRVRLPDMLWFRWHRTQFAVFLRPKLSIPSQYRVRVYCKNKYYIFISIFNVAASRCVAAIHQRRNNCTLKCCLLCCVFSANHGEEQHTKLNIVFGRFGVGFSFGRARYVCVCVCVFLNSNHIVFDLFVVVSWKYHKSCAQPDASRTLNKEMKGKMKFKQLKKKKHRKNKLINIGILVVISRDQCEKCRRGREKITPEKLLRYVFSLFLSSFSVKTQQYNGPENTCSFFFSSHQHTSR